MEAEAVFTVQQVAATAFLLYMCKLCRFPQTAMTVPDTNFQQPPLPSIWSARSSKPPLRQACRTDRILPRNLLIVEPCNDTGRGGYERWATPTLDVR